jgi:hypothetical protein
MLLRLKLKFIFWYIVALTKIAQFMMRQISNQTGSSITFQCLVEEETEYFEKEF